MIENLTFENWNGNENAIAKMEEEIFPQDAWSLSCIKDSVNFPLFFGEVCKNHNGEVVGYYGINIIAGEGYIANIAVSKKFQSKGMGNLLIQRILQACKSRDCEEITLEVRISNAVAISLYKKHGFIIEAERKNFYSDGESAYIMWKHG